MDKITIFTVPRYFKPPFAMIQYNAIRSWLLLKPTPEIILCGNDEGVAEVAKELGIIHIPDVGTSRLGTPLVSSVFIKAQKIAKHPILAYVNSDIILMDDFLKTIAVVANAHPHQFVIVGQRQDLDVRKPINFSRPRWEDRLRKRAMKSGKLHHPCGIDYYVFRKRICTNMPPFVAGRPSWDNWFLAQALQKNIGVIDATSKIFVVHQNHDYSHANGIQNARQGIEATLNRKLAGGERVYIDNASWEFVKGKLVRKPRHHFLMTWTDTNTNHRGNLADIIAYDELDALRQAERLNREFTKMEKLDSAAFEKGAFQIELERIDTQERQIVTYIAFDEKDAKAAWHLRGRIISNFKGYQCLVTSVKRLKMHKNLVVQ